MKQSIILNIVVAAVSGGAVAGIIQLSNAPISIKNTAVNPSAVYSQTSKSQAETQLVTFREELNRITDALEKLSIKQIKMDQVQNDLSISLNTPEVAPNTQVKISTAENYQNQPIEPAESTEKSGSEHQLSRIYLLDTQMRMLDKDNIWEMQAHSTITQGLENINLAGSALQSLECQGTMCRIEVAHNTEADAEVFFEDSVKIVPWNHRGKLELVEDDNGGIVSIYYVTRDGGDFPRQ